MKYYDSMGFESENGIWVRRVDVAALEAENERLAILLRRASFLMQTASQGDADVRKFIVEQLMRKFISEVERLVGSPSSSDKLSTPPSLSDTKKETKAEPECTEDCVRLGDQHPECPKHGRDAALLRFAAACQSNRKGEPT